MNAFENFEPELAEMVISNGWYTPEKRLEMAEILFLWAGQLKASARRMEETGNILIRATKGQKAHLN